MYNNQNWINKIFQQSYSFIPQISYKRLTKIKQRKNKMIIILYTFGAILYLISLCHLSGVDMRCFFWFGEKCYYAIFILVFISSILISISIYIIIFQNNKKIHLFIIFIIYIFFYIIDNNAEVIKHGFYNFILSITMNLIIFIFLLYIHFLYYLFKNQKYFFFFYINNSNTFFIYII